MNAKTPEQRVREYIARTGNTNPMSLKYMMNKQPGGYVPMAIIRSVCAEFNSQPKAKSKKTMNTISLANARVLDRKPSEGIKMKIYQLKKGVGYPIAELASEWHCTPDTIRNHAKALGVAKYVEASPGEWIYCVMHPETAKQFSAT